MRAYHDEVVVVRRPAPGDSDCSDERARRTRPLARAPGRRRRCARPPAGSAPTSSPRRSPPLASRPERCVRRAPHAACSPAADPTSNVRPRRTQATPFDIWSRACCRMPLTPASDTQPAGMPRSALGPLSAVEPRKLVPEADPGRTLASTTFPTISRQSTAPPHPAEPLASRRSREACSARAHPVDDELDRRIEVLGRDPLREVVGHAACRSPARHSRSGARSAPARSRGTGRAVRAARSGADRRVRVRGRERVAAPAALRDPHVQAVLPRRSRRHSGRRGRVGACRRRRRSSSPPAQARPPAARMVALTPPAAGDAGAATGHQTISPRAASRSAIPAIASQPS